MRNLSISIETTYTVVLDGVVNCGTKSEIIAIIADYRENHD